MPYSFTWFNLFLPGVAALLVWTGGCATTPEDKRTKAEKEAVTAMRFHVETGEHAASSRTINVLRNSPVEIYIDKEAVIDERDVKSARLMDANGTYMIRVDLTMHGQLVLEMESVSHLGRRMAIQATWSTGKETPETRWLAAPEMAQPLRQGSIAFTPDSSREEAKAIVMGLNNIAVKLKNQPKPGKEDADKNRIQSPDRADDAIKTFKEAR